MDASISAEKCRGNENLQASSSTGTKEVTEPLLATHVEDEFEELSEEIPDPFSDDEGDIIELSNETFLQQPIGMVTSITSMVNTDIEEEEEEEGEEKENEGLTPIFVPSLSYLAQVCSFLLHATQFPHGWQVPSELQAAMLGSEKGDGVEIFGEARFVFFILSTYSTHLGYSLLVKLLRVLDFEPYRPNKTKPYLTYSPNLPTDLTYMINPPDGQVLTYPLTYHYNL